MNRKLVNINKYGCALLFLAANLAADASAAKDLIELASNTASSDEYMKRLESISRDLRNNEARRNSPPPQPQSPTSKANTAYQKGNELRIQGETDLAIAEYSNAISLNPKLANAYFHRGLCWEEKNALDIALSDFTKFRELSPNDGRARTAIKRVIDKIAKNSQERNPNGRTPERTRRPNGQDI
jgi:tetratricopeptide (TPR) repeat protein